MPLRSNFLEHVQNRVGIKVDIYGPIVPDFIRNVKFAKDSKRLGKLEQLQSAIHRQRKKPATIYIISTNNTSEFL